MGGKGRGSEWVGEGGVVSGWEREGVVSGWEG